MTNTPLTQQETGMMIYPNSGWRRFAFKMPLYLWRLGFKQMLPANFLVLTTTGRKSGEPRHTMLEHTRLDDDFYLGSGWGWRSHWVKNLEADPLATVQTLQGEVVSVHAEPVIEPEALAAMYPKAQVSPMWADYLASWGVEDTQADFVAAHQDGRLLTYRLSSVDDPTPPTLNSDLKWVSGTVSILLLLGLGWLLQKKARR